MPGKRIREVVVPKKKEKTRNEKPKTVINKDIEEVSASRTTPLRTHPIENVNTPPTKLRTHKVTDSPQQPKRHSKAATVIEHPITISQRKVS